MRNAVSLAWLVGSLVLLALLPAVMTMLDSGYWFRLTELGLVFAVLAVSLNLMTGTAGLVSLGHAAFYAVGAYTTALLATRTSAGLLATLPASMIVAGLFGALVAFPMLRLLRVFFTVATLSVGAIVNIAITNWDAVTGGPNGFRDIPGFSLGGAALSGRLAAYYVVAIVALAAFWAVDRLTRSPYGTALRALREDEVSASAAGIETRGLKIGVLALAAAFAGAAGCLTAHTTGFISPDMFQLDQSILILTMVVVGGLGSPPGAVAGAFLLTVVPELVRSAGHFRMVAVGVLLFGAILLLPNGSMG